MANNHKRKIGLPKAENYAGSTSGHVRVIKHFDSDVPLGKLQNCELPEKTFHVNKDFTCKTNKQHVISHQQKNIKFSSASKSTKETIRNPQGTSLLNTDSASTSLPTTKTSLRKRYPSLPSKFKQEQNSRKEGCANFSSKSFKELDITPMTHCNLKSPSESNALATLPRHSGCSDSQVKNKENWYLTTKPDNYEGTTPKVDMVPHRSGSSICVQACKTKPILDVPEKNFGKTTKLTSSCNDDHRGYISNSNECVKDQCKQNKRKHLAELKTEIAKFRSTKKHSLNANESVVNAKKQDSQMNIQLEKIIESTTSLYKGGQENVETTPSLTKLNCEDDDIYDTVAVILQNRVIIPNSDEFGSYPFLPNKNVSNKPLDQNIPQTDTSEAESEIDVNDDEVSVSGSSAFEQNLGRLVTPKELKDRVDSEIELNSKIEQNKMLINKVQKVLNIIKLGVQFPTSPLEDHKLEKNISDVIFRESKCEVETAVHIYEEIHSDQVLKSDTNVDVEEISIEEMQEDALRVQTAKSDAESMVPRIREITSEDTFKPSSITDEDVADEENLARIEDDGKQENLKENNQSRPLTRRNGEIKWRDDKFRTEPVIADHYSEDISDFETVQAKLNTIHDETESSSEDMYTESVTKEIPLTGELSDVHVNSISNAEAYNTSKNRVKCVGKSINRSNIEHKQPEDDVREIKSDIRKVFPFKSRIIEENVLCKSDKKYQDKQWTLKNKQLVDSKRSIHSFANGDLQNASQFILDVKPDVTESIDLCQKSKKKRDVASNTKSLVEYKDNACITDDSGRGTDFTCNTETVKCRETASNTEQPAKLKDVACCTKNFARRHAASNTECKRNDFACTARPQQKDFACKTDLRKVCCDAICDTEYLKIKTNNVMCSTDIRTVPVATQKCRLDGTHMTFESVENIDIPSNKNLRKSNSLQIQLLPTINITSLPTIQKIFHFYIDKNGKTHLSYQPSKKTIGYIEAQSPSYYKEIEANVTQPTNTEQRSYEQGFREIKKVEPLKPRSPRQKCKFFINHKYNPDYESSSGTCKIIQLSHAKIDYQNLNKIDVCSGDDGEFFIDLKTDYKTQTYHDDSRISRKKRGKYLKRTCSDSSLVVKTIKEASTYAFASNSETNSRIESICESQQIYSSKNRHSSGESSQWVGELNLDKRVFKSNFNLDGFSQRHSRWRSGSEKTHTNLECFTKHNAKEYKKPMLCNSVETQTTPWCLESVSKSTFTSNCDLDQAMKSNTNSISTSNQSHSHQRSQSESPEISLNSSNSISIKNSVKGVLETTREALKPACQIFQDECMDSKMKGIVNFSVDSGESLMSNRILQNQEMNYFETCKAVSPSDNNESISWNKNSLTVTCSREKSSTKNLSNPPNVLQTDTHISKSSRYVKPDRHVKIDKNKADEKTILQKNLKYVSVCKDTKRNNEAFGIDEKEKKVDTQKTVRINIESDLLLNQMTKNYLKNCQSTKVGDNINKKTNQTHIETDMLHGDSVLINKQKKIQNMRIKHKEKNDHVDEIINKFRNIYMINSDTTQDTSERSMSEGEIRCCCSTSTGEIHECKQIDKKLQMSRLYQKNLEIAPFKKRRNYFNYWTTYYFNKHSRDNNSGSTS